MSEVILTEPVRTASNEKLYLNFIDGLRAIAVVAVLLFHIDRTRVTGGYVSVDIFFVISGF